MKRRLCAALVTAALAGCGGGGGGGSSPGVTAPVVAPAGGGGTGPAAGENGVPPASSAPFPTLDAATDVRVYTAVIEGINGPTRGQVSAQGNGANSFTFTVNRVGDTPAYSFTVNTSNRSSLFRVDGTSCGDCFRSAGIATGTVVGQIYYLDSVFAGMSYVSIGAWGVQNSRSQGDIEITSNGAGVFGVPTRTADIPKTGTASYTGQFLGIYQAGISADFVGATASAVANFGSGVVALSTTNSQGQRGGSMPELDFAGTMTGISSNQLRGSMVTRGGMTGDAHGAFFGPAAQELGGAVQFKGRRGPTDFGNEAFIGAFGLRKQ
jgi:transferrin binding protein